MELSAQRKREQAVRRLSGDDESLRIIDENLYLIAVQLAEGRQKLENWKSCCRSYRELREGRKQLLYHFEKEKEDAESELGSIDTFKRRITPVDRDSLFIVKTGPEKLLECTRRILDCFSSSNNGA